MASFLFLECTKRGIVNKPMRSKGIVVHTCAEVQNKIHRCFFMAKYMINYISNELQVTLAFSMFHYQFSGLNNYVVIVTLHCFIITTFILIENLQNEHFQKPNFSLITQMSQTQSVTHKYLRCLWVDLDVLYCFGAQYLTMKPFLMVSLHIPVPLVQNLYFNLLLSA